MSFIFGPAYALIDGQTGNFSDSFIDLPGLSSQDSLELKRTYNSRIYFKGYFGIGWCTSFETKLEFVSANEIERVHCGAGKRIRFVKKPDADTYFAYQPKNGTIRNTERGFLHITPDGAKELFDSRGLLLGWRSAGGRKVVLKYDSNRVFKSAHDVTGGHVLRFHMDKNHLVQKAELGGKLVSAYQYTKGKLTSVQNGFGNVYLYRYNSQARLTRIIYPDKTSDSIHYNKRFNWVTELRTRDRCLEKLNYHILSNFSHRVTVTRTCDKAKPITAKIEYHYKRTSYGPELAMKKVVSGENAMSIGYMDRAPAKVEHLEYDDFGRLVEAKFDIDHISVRFDSQGRPERIMSQRYGIFNLEYIPNTAHIASIRNKDVGAVQFQYHPDGSLVAVTGRPGDKTKTEVTERYRQITRLINDKMYRRSNYAKIDNDF